MLKRQNKNKKRISSNVIAILGAFIIVIGGFFLFNNFIQSKKVMAYDYMANIFYNENDQQAVTEFEKEENKGEPKAEKEENKEVTNDYIGYLTIPKINLTKGFLDQKAEDNNVDKNILVVEGSSYPDVEKGNLIIAGHSGNAWNSFFDNLYKLQVNDEAYVDYNNKRYTYKIVNIYKQQKVGTIAIYRDYNKTTLTLVTCTNNDSTTQTVYIAELQEVKDK